MSDEMPVMFVTGATGFVGSAVARALLDQGYRLRVLARPRSNRSNISGLKNVEIIEGDLCKPNTYAQALNGCKGLFHVAADYRIWVPNVEEMNKVNIEGTQNLMKAALKAGVEKIVYTSSVATLGINPNGTPSDENTPSTLGDMVGVYKQSKFLAEQAVMKMIHDDKLPCVIVNPSTPIGPRDIKPTPTGRIIVETMAGRMPAYVETGLNIVHVDDVAKGHLLAFEKGRIGERYILGGYDLELGEILSITARIAGKTPPKFKLPIEPLFPLAYAAEFLARFTKREPFITVDGLRMARKLMFFSSAKAIAELGYSARPAPAALSDAINWFRANSYC